MTTNAKYYSPAQIVTIANASTEIQEFRGLGGEVFAWNKLNIGCDDASKLNQIKATATTLEGRKTIFENVQLEALRRLFESRKLVGAFQIDKTRTLKLELNNVSGATRHVGIDLSGFDAPQFEKILGEYAQKGLPYPEVEFIYATAQIGASAVQQRVKMNIPQYDTNLYRIAISSTSDSNLQVSFRVNNEEVIPPRFVAQINNQFKTELITLPIRISKSEPFEVAVTNLDGGNAHEISIICEAYTV